MEELLAVATRRDRSLCQCGEVVEVVEVVEAGSGFVAGLEGAFERYGVAR